MGVTDALEAPQRRVDDVGHRIPNVAYRFRELLAKTPKGILCVMVSSSLLAIIAVCLLATFVGIASHSGDMAGAVVFL